MIRKRAPNSFSIVCNIGCTSPQGGHSKSPNSSSCAGASGGPIVCGGSAPGSEDTTTLGCGDALGTGVLAWIADRLIYKTVPTAAARTARMMINGSSRFMCSEERFDSESRFSLLGGSFVEYAVRIRNLKGYFKPRLPTLR